MSALIQGSKEWLNLRKTKIGASDAPIILGISPWKTPYQLWQEKVCTTVPIKNTEYMQRGLDLEDTAREFFKYKTGLDMKPDVIFSNKYDWQMASLDGIDVKKSHILEIKCPGAKDHAVALDGKIPEKYYPQLQHQLAVVDLDMAYYFSFDGIDGIIIEVKRNNEYIEMMIEAEKQFYQCMIDISPPKFVDKDFIYKNDNEWLSIANEWKQVSNEIKHLEEKQKNLRETLIKLANESNIKGGGITISKSVRKGNIDYSLIPELKNINLEEYRKEPIEVWRINTN